MFQLASSCRRHRIHWVSALVCVAALVGASSFAAAPTPTGYPAPSFVPPAGHPRVYFTAKDLPRILANTTRPQNAAAWAACQALLREGTDGVLPAPTGKQATNFNVHPLAIIESEAFDFALRGNQESGRNAVTALRNFLRTVVFLPSDYDNAGQTIYTIGAVYDWCYSLLSADDRAGLYKAMISAAGHLEVGWPPVKQGDVVGHGPEGQVMRDLMSAAIAMYDEHPEVYRIVAGRFFDRMVPAKLFMYQGHSHPQGAHYTYYRGQWEMLATWLFDRIGLREVFGPDQHYFLYWTLYARRPDGQLLRDGDNHLNNTPLGTYQREAGRTLLLAANYFNDPYLKGEALREVPNLAPSETARGNQVLTPVEILVFNNPDLEGRPVSELPLTHYFPTPRGGMIARTGWEEGAQSNAVVVEMKMNEWFYSNHQHNDAGAFQIYYRGSLATDSGYYQATPGTHFTTTNDGGSAYGSLHDYFYEKRSVAHNVMLVHDPRERFEIGKRVLPNDGGQRFPHNRTDPRDQQDLMDPESGYHIAQVLGHGFGPDAAAPDYTYLKGDLAKAYSDKIKAYERAFVFLNLKQAEHPAVLLVFDRVVTSKPAFQKEWVLHGLEQPQIDGHRVTFRDTRAGYSGKLVVDALWPEASQITAIGGPGKEAWVDGVNYAAKTNPKANNEGGGWRIGIVPAGARDTDYFLNVLQVGDHRAGTPDLAVERIESPTHLGARIADHIVLFGRDRARMSAPVTFTVAGPRARVLVDDLKAGRWTIERDGQPVGTVSVAANDGVATFDADPGAYRLTAASPRE